MRRIYLWSSLALLQMGALLWYETAARVAESRWYPVSGAMPRPGCSVSVPFQVVSSGRYGFQVQAPMAHHEREADREPRRLVGNLNVLVSGPNQIQVAQHVASLALAATTVGKSGSERIGIFAAGTFDLRRGGGYLCTVSNADLPGSELRFGLELQESNFEGQLIAADLGRVVGILLMVSSLICGLKHFAGVSSSPGRKLPVAPGRRVD